MENKKQQHRHYIQGSLWRTRTGLACWSEKISYIPANKMVMFLDELCVGFSENIKVLYDGHMCYLEDIDVAHSFDLNPYDKKEK